MLNPDQQQGDLAGTSYYPQEPNDLTGGLPINLDSLRDGPPGSKPFYPYSTLIRYAYDMCML
jgi:forkhead box protein J2/3